MLFNIFKYAYYAESCQLARIRLVRILYQLFHKDVYNCITLPFLSTFNSAKSVTEIYVCKTYAMVSRKQKALPDFAYFGSNRSKNL